MGRVVLSSICCLLFISAFAGDREKKTASTRKHPHGIHRHNFELFAGATVFPRSQYVTLFTAGVDYEHRFRDFHNHFGIGLLADHEFQRVSKQKMSETLITPTIIYFPTKHLKTFAGVGVAFIGDKSYFLKRFGIGYEVDVTEHLVLSPTICLDWTNIYTAFVCGVAFGIGI